jgi:hypothetical protein
MLPRKRRRRTRRMRKRRERKGWRQMHLDAAGVGGAVDRSGVPPTGTSNDGQLRLRLRRPRGRRRRMCRWRGGKQKNQSRLFRSSTTMPRSGRWTESGHVGVNATAASSNGEQKQRDIASVGGLIFRTAPLSPPPLPRPCS